MEGTLQETVMLVAVGGSRVAVISEGGSAADEGQEKWTWINGKS